MKKLIAFGAFMAPLSMTAFAEVIDFEDINVSGGFGGTRENFNNLGIENTYHGYTWSTNQTGTFWAAVNNADFQFNTVLAHNGQQAGWGWNGPSQLIVDFGTDKNVSGAWFNVFAAGQDWGFDAVQMRGYDSSNNLVGSTAFVALDDVNSNPSWVNVVANFSGVRKLVIEGQQADTNWGTNGWLTIDDLELTPVPEPATLVALGAGLIALARKRRK